jgi:hypothetical protein
MLLNEIASHRYWISRSSRRSDESAPPLAQTPLPERPTALDAALAGNSPVLCRPRPPAPRSGDRCHRPRRLARDRRRRPTPPLDGRPSAGSPRLGSSTVSRPRPRTEFSPMRRNLRRPGPGRRELPLGPVPVTSSSRNDPESDRTAADKPQVGDQARGVPFHLTGDRLYLPFKYGDHAGHVAIFTAHRARSGPGLDARPRDQRPVGYAVTRISRDLMHETRRCC